jgi:hypothetical protein
LLNGKLFLYQPKGDICSHCGHYELMIGILEDKAHGRHNLNFTRLGL